MLQENFLPLLNNRKNHSDYQNSTLKCCNIQQQFSQSGKIGDIKEKNISTPVINFSRRLLPSISTFEIPYQKFRIPAFAVIQNNIAHQTQSQEKIVDNPTNSCESREKAISYIEKRCSQVGLRFHSKRGFILLKNFFIYLFPHGIDAAPSQTFIKKLNMQQFAEILMLVDSNFPESFTKEHYEKFLEIYVSEAK